MPTIAEQMSSWTVALHYSHLPAEVTHLAKRMIIDTIWCAIGAYTSEPSKIARDLAATVASALALHCHRQRPGYQPRPGDLRQWGDDSLLGLQ